MQITAVTTTLLRYPHGDPIQDATIYPPPPGAGGRSELFVHIATDEGVTGLGVGIGNGGVRAIVEQNLAAVLIGQDPFRIDWLWDRMFWQVRSYGRKGAAFCAISAVDIALWDLKAKALGLPLYRLLGPYHEQVPIYGSGGWTNLDERALIAEQTDYIERLGVRAVKMKVGKDFGKSEAEDVRRLAAVRRAIGDDVELLIDANNGYYAKQAIRMARCFEEFNVGWFEEPVLADDIAGLAAVARETTIPIATGEHEYTKYGFKDLIAREAVDIVQPDVGRVGGISEWLKVSHLAHAFNLPVAPHAFQLVHLHLAMATPNLRIVEYLGAVEQGDRIWYTEFPQPQDGLWAPYPDKPGLGLELSPQAVERYAI